MGNCKTCRYWRQKEGQNVGWCKSDQTVNLRESDPLATAPIGGVGYWSKSGAAGLETHAQYGCNNYRPSDETAIFYSNLTLDVSTLEPALLTMIAALDAATMAGHHAVAQYVRGGYPIAAERLANELEKMPALNAKLQAIYAELVAVMAEKDEPKETESPKQL